MSTGNFESMSGKVQNHMNHSLVITCHSFCLVCPSIPTFSAASSSSLYSAMVAGLGLLVDDDPFLFPVLLFLLAPPTAPLMAILESPPTPSAPAVPSFLSPVLSAP